MSLRTLMIRANLNRKNEELEELLAQDGAFAARETELAAAIGEAVTPEERETVEAAVNSFEEEHSAHVSAVNSLRDEISALQTQLDGIEAQTPPAPAQTAAEINNERNDSPMNTINIRSLPMSVRAFDALPLAQRQEITAREDVKGFLAQLRSFKGARASVSGGELLIPVVFLDLIAENLYRYSKLLNRVRIRNVAGEARQTIAGIVPEAVWTEMCGTINELTFQFNQVTLDGYKVAGFVPVCNSLLEDNDINLASWIVEMLSESVGLAMDKAILYGKGSGYHMPLGIVTRLAQQSQPAGYPASAPEWVDLHTTNIKSLNGSLTGTAFWAALQEAVAAAYGRYSRGEMFWAMNSKTYAKLKAKAIATNLDGAFVAMIGGTLPIVSGDIDILEFMPDDNIVGGFGDLYLVGLRAGMTIEASREVQFIQDNTVFKGKMRADGIPVIAQAFVAIDINGGTPVSEMSFAPDAANTVSGIQLNTATATVAGTGTVQLKAILLPYGVKGDVSWASATTAKATVSSSGLVTGVTSGSSVITATCNGFTAQCTVTVT